MQEEDIKVLVEIWRTLATGGVVMRRKATIPLYSAQRSKALYYLWAFKQTHMQNQHIKYLNKD